jgi:hypothetical protein
MTENTTASGAADFPEFPGHPEPQIMRWSALEIVAIREYGADMFRAGRLAASAPKAEPAPPQEAQLNPDMPTQELRLHMGELTTDEVLVARAAIRWANTYGITAAQKENTCAPTP